MKGCVKFFKERNGYGFIVRDDGGGDVFFHCSDVVEGCLDKIGEGVEVSFELAESDKGFKAVEVFAV